MRVGILAIEDPLFVFEFFEEFVSLWNTNQRKFDISIVMLCEYRGKRVFSKGLFKKTFTLYGKLGTFLLGMEYIFKMMMAKVTNFKRWHKAYTVEQLFIKNSIRVIRVDDINSPYILKQLKNIDLILSVSIPQRLKKEILSFPTFRCINVHSGKLPKYRGLLPTFWQMLCGEKNIGVSVHFVNERIDDGDILTYSEFPLRSNDSLYRIMKRAKIEGARLAFKTIERISSGNCTIVPNDRTKATYYKFPSSKDVQAFKRIGWKLR
ncbi:hypothetical protein HQ584_00720 [Patescibacteria group bacterium]|nr:hypothetical protein [Patescibacteria group bacterium]